MSFFYVQEHASKVSVFCLPFLYVSLVSLQEKKRISSLIFNHAVGLNSLLSTLVQGWTGLGPAASASMEDSFNLFSGQSARPANISCAQQGKDDSHVEESSSDSESSNENIEERTETVPRCSPRLSRSSGEVPSGTLPSQDNSMKHGKSAASIEKRGQG